MDIYKNLSIIQREINSQLFNNFFAEYKEKFNITIIYNILNLPTRAYYVQINRKLSNRALQNKKRGNKMFRWSVFLY